jgi:hypothetical protein
MTSKNLGSNFSSFISSIVFPSKVIYLILLYLSELVVYKNYPLLAWLLEIRESSNRANPSEPTLTTPPKTAKLSVMMQS